MSEATAQNTIALLRYLWNESGLKRSPVMVFVLVASVSRTALIFLINETAERGGATLWLFAALIGVAGVLLYCTHMATMTGATLVQRLAKQMRSAMMQRLLRADVNFFLNRDPNELHHTSIHQVNNVAGATIRMADSIQAVLILSFMFIYMFVQLPASVIGTVIAMALGLAAFFINEGPATRAVRQSHKAHAEFHSSLSDILYGYKELRLRRARREDLTSRVEGEIDRVEKLALKSERHYSFGRVTAQGALTALLISIVAVSPLFTEVDSVMLLQILTLILFSFGPIENMVSGLPDFARAGVSYRVCEDLNDELDQNAEAPEPPRASPRDSFQSIELRGVTVTLTRDVGGSTEAKDSFTLGPIDLKLVPGQSVFITGGNGMGKSTLLSLLTGLRYPDQGEVLIDGVPVTRETISDYRSVFSAVFGEFYMFKTLYGLGAEDRARLIKHVAEMGIAEGVSLDGDTFTNLALSTGQKRRLALSIALAEERPVIVLDEFAADQDPARRRFFYDELVHRLSAAGHCVVAVTHDEHCFDKADRLIRMEDGKIVSDEMTGR